MSQSERKLSLPPVNPTTAGRRAREILDRAKAAVGFIPNMYTGMANSPALLDTYLHGYDLFRQESGFLPPEQEVVFLVISRENGCTYCVGAHSFIADKKSGLAPVVTDAIRDGRSLPDAKLEALSRFVQVMVRTRGLPPAAAVDAFTAAGYSERHILNIILAIAVKTISNYSNHMFHTELDAVFASRKWTAPV